VYQQPQVVYQQPAAQPQPVYQQPVVYQAPVQQVQYKAPEPAPSYTASAAQQAGYTPSYAQSGSAAGGAAGYTQSGSSDSGAAAAYTPSYTVSGGGGGSSATSSMSSEQHAHQRFTYDASSGYITGFDGRVLDVDGGSWAEKTKVIFYDKKPDNSTNQQWDYVDGSFVSRMGTGFVIDIDGAQMRNHTDLILWRKTGGNNQKWDIDANGFIRSRMEDAFCISVKGGAKWGKGATDLELHKAGH